MKAFGKPNHIHQQTTISKNSPFVTLLCIFSLDIYIVLYFMKFEQNYFTKAQRFSLMLIIYIFLYITLTMLCDTSKM